MVRKYTSRSDGRKAEPFELDGVVFHPGDAVTFLDITELGRFANQEMASPEGAAAIGEFFKLLLGEDYDRFREHIRTHRTDEDTIVRVLHDVLEDLSSHPTQRPSDSPAGPTSTGRTLRVVSLSQGTVDEMPIDEDRVRELLAQAAADTPEQQAG